MRAAPRASTVGAPHVETSQLLVYPVLWILVPQEGARAPHPA